MKLALIPPFELMEYTDETSMQLMLPHLLHSETYRYVYQKHCDDPNQYVILDNGEAEGMAVLPSDLLEIASAYGVNELVLPDNMKNGDSTKTKALRFFDKEDWRGRGLNFMYVVQGTKYSEFLQQAMWAATYPNIDVIGVPRHMIETCDNPRARHSLCMELRTLTEKPVHLLGGSPLHPTELRSYAWPKNVRSTDTSSAFNYAFEHLKLRVGNEVYRPTDYFTIPWDAFDLDVLNYNVKKLKEWTGNDV